MILSKPPILAGYNFSPEKARGAREQGRLLSMRTETSLVCNIQCRYCNGTSGTAPPGEISLGTIKDVISQVKELGGESVVVIGGGEPTIYPHFRELIHYIAEKEMTPVVITNTTTMSSDMAKFLYNENASVLTKLDSLNETRQDFLAAKEGTYQRIRKGLDNLMEVYTDGADGADGIGGTGDRGNAGGNPLRLRVGVSFVTTSLTLDETPDIWKFCREHNLYPNQEALVPRGRALAELSDLTPTIKQLNDVKRKLLEIDEKEYGYTWLVHAPLTGNGCFQHLYSIYLTSKGYIRPCADVDIEEFNVKDMNIKEILATPFFQMAQHIEDYLQGKCGGCGHVKDCIGCRGIAFSTGINEGLGIYEAIRREDPLCDKICREIMEQDAFHKVIIPAEGNVLI